MMRIHPIGPICHQLHLAPVIRRGFLSLISQNSFGDLPNDILAVWDHPPPLHAREVQVVTNPFCCRSATTHVIPNKWGCLGHE